MFNLSAQEVAIGTASDQMTGSFLPFVYEDMNLYTSQMMEHMDECALDFIWNGLWKQAPSYWSHGYS